MTASAAGRILVTLSSFCEADDTPRRLLADSPFTVVENPSGKRITPEEILAAGTDWVGLIAGVEPYKSETLSRLSGLRCISRVGTGIDAIDLDYCRSHNIVVRNTPDAPTDAVAEMTLAQILDLLKQLSWHNANIKARNWTKRTGLMLHGRTVGIVGLGKIGRAVAERLAAFGAKLIGSDPAPDAAWAARVGLRYVSLDELLRSADVVTLHAAGKSGQPPLLGPREFGLMKAGAILVNTARGYLVDAGALADALRSGRLAAAGLDVFPEEPYKGPLCDLDNVIMTPHISTLTLETRIRMETEAVQNLLEELGK